jgi:alanine racemase
MARPTEALLSTDHLLHNIRWIQNKIGSSKIIAMVKANAYGHGIRSVSQRIADHVHMFGVASIDEAIVLRTCGIQTPIMLAEGVFDSGEWEIAAKYHCQVVIHTLEQIQWLEHLLCTHPIRVWLKINTGMNRLGFPPRDVPALYTRLSQNPRVEKPVGLVSHFASSEIENDAKSMAQSSKMRAVMAAIPGFQGPVTLCNSGGILNGSKEDYYDYVRPGLLIHGVSPKSGVTGRSLGLRPVMTLQSKLISVYTAQKGDEIGYGSHFSCPEIMPIGIAAIGYGDGYPFRAPSGTPVLVNGIMCALVGRVSMDMLAIDLRACARAKIGDQVTLWGDELPIETVAAFAQEIPYTLLTGLQNRVRCRWSSLKTPSYEGSTDPLPNISSECAFGSNIQQ